MYFVKREIKEEDCSLFIVKLKFPTTEWENYEKFYFSFVKLDLKKYFTIVIFYSQ